MTERADGMARQLIRDAVREMLLLYGTFPGAAERQATEREWELRIYKEAVKPLESDLAEARRLLGAELKDYTEARAVLVAERDAALRENEALRRERDKYFELSGWAGDRLMALDSAASRLCRWIRHTVPEWTPEVEKYLELTEASLKPGDSPTPEAQELLPPCGHSRIEHARLRAGECEWGPQ